VPALPDAPDGYYARAGYRLAGQRSVRIDMLERLADMLRGMDSRSGFEANADMLSITGLTLEQFADLMSGLGYTAECGERPKLKAAPEASEPPSTPATETETTTDEVPEVEASVEVPETKAVAEVAETEKPQEDKVDEVEVFFTFRWAAKPRAQQGPRGGNRNERQGQGKGKPKGKRGKPQGNRQPAARPQSKDKPFDPDNPFAALAALKAKD